jgi:hypothetical protein
MSFPWGELAGVALEAAASTAQQVYAQRAAEAERKRQREDSLSDEQRNLQAEFLKMMYGMGKGGGGGKSPNELRMEALAGAFNMESAGVQQVSQANRATAQGAQNAYAMAGRR